MFSQLIFLLFVLLLISSGNSSNTFLFTPGKAMMLALLAYGIVLTLILLQKKLGRLVPLLKKWSYPLVQITLILYLCFYYYILGADRLLTFSWYSSHPIQIISSLFTFTLYLGGLFLYYFISSVRKTSLYQKERVFEAFSQLRLIFPLLVPFLVFTLAIDFYNQFENKNFHPSILLWSGFLAFIGFILASLIFMPYVMKNTWGCSPFQDKDLEKKLLELCQKAHFKHGGILLWGILQQAPTAAIIGIIPRFRYILFTKRLTEALSTEELEAVLIHEIGHSYRKHLLLYPLIFLGMIPCLGLLGSFLFSPLIIQVNLWQYFYPLPFYSALIPLLIFLLSGALIALYIRFVIGFFSRLFERQADLHVFYLKKPPQDLVKALDRVGVLTGYSHRVPNWHHYSLKERMEFLESCEKHPEKVEQHHHLVKKALSFFFLAFILLSCLAFSSFGTNHFFLSPWAKKIESWQIRTEAFWNQSLRDKIIDDYLKKNEGIQNKRKIRLALQKTLTQDEIFRPGITEALSADMLLQQHEINASTELMTLAWKNLPVSQKSDELEKTFLQLSKEILQKNPDLHLKNQLIQAIPFKID